MTQRRHNSSIVPQQLLRWGDQGIEIVWTDGSRMRYRFDDLRRACPCAECQEDRQNGSDADAGISLTVLPDNAADMYTPTEIRPTGRYAYTILWADGHHTGIYSFELLYQLGRPSP